MNERGLVDRLAPLRDDLIRQDDHRDLILLGDVERIDGRVKRILDVAQRQHHARHVAVAAVERVEEIRLLALRRDAGRRPAALDVDDDARNLRDRREPEHLRHQRQARPDVAVIDFAPANEAPTTAPIAASSSSVCRHVPPILRQPLARADAGSPTTA